MNPSAALLKPLDHGTVVLESFQVHARIHSVLSEVTVTQVYRNSEEFNIEAVYTFPLPVDAVLLDLTLELNGENLRGTVVPNTQAEEEYETAIESGDSAVLLKQTAPGLFTVNLGNLLAGEKARIRFRYVQLHHWQGEELRFHLPTTLAPRYGDPLAHGLQPHEVPAYTLENGTTFDLQVTIEGQLSIGGVSCPSHPVDYYLESGQLLVQLNDPQTTMDRDFILLLKKPTGYAGECLFARDGDGYVALASFCPRLEQPAIRAPHCLKLVVDCSGSMSGLSIVQARTAMHEILQLLQPEDWFNVTLFGSNVRTLFDRPLPANRENLERAAGFLDGMNADMGGTEMGNALEATYRQRVPEGMPNDLLLITDGEVWEHELLIQRAKESGHRLFTVGVGGAVSEALLRKLAEASGGACELVSPNEGMASRIVRHYERMHQAPVTSLRVRWPQEADWQHPTEPTRLFSGDTLLAFAHFQTPPADSVCLEYRVQDQVESQSLEITAWESEQEETDALARLATHARLPSLDAETARALAIEYQLITDQTSCVLVKTREEAAEGIPLLRSVPHTLAQGWGGIGTSMDLLMECRRDTSYSIGVSEVDDVQFLFEEEPDSLDLEMPRAAEVLFAELARAHLPLFSRTLQIPTLEELEDVGFEKSIMENLRRWIAEGHSEAEVVVAFLSALLTSSLVYSVPRHLRRLIHRAEADLDVDVYLKEEIEDAL